MEDWTNLLVRRLGGGPGTVSYQYTRVRFFSGPVETAWTPAINVYRSAEAFVICADLAGVDRESLDVQVESRRLWIRGRRPLPEPDPAAGPVQQVLALEIDHGHFAREVVLPTAVEPGKFRAELQNGLLWLRLPLASRE